MADEPEQDELKQAAEKVRADLVALNNDLAVRQVPEEHEWFRRILVGILNATQQNYRSVKIGVEKMPTLAAWGARNLLELRVVTAYVLMSENNAWEFMDDFLVDLKEFWEAITRNSALTHNGGVRCAGQPQG
jgi:hypothetical protein